MVNNYQNQLYSIEEGIPGGQSPESLGELLKHWDIPELPITVRKSIEKDTYEARRILENFGKNLSTTKSR